MITRVASPRLVGRDSQLEVLERVLAAAGSGQAAVVLVGGEAGIGKTRLVDELADRATAQGALVLCGGCVDLGEASVPFAPVVEALRGLLRTRGEDTLLDSFPGSSADLGRLLPELGGSAAPVESTGAFGSAQARLFELLLGLLHALGLDQPVLLVLEDLHWADASTRDLVAYLARNLHQERVVLLATFRSDELHRRHPLRPLLAELERSAGVVRLDLPRLRRDELAAQVAGILGAPAPTQEVERLFDRTGGNAFFTEELVAAGGGSGRGSLPPTLHEILAVRIEALSEQAQAVLRVVAVGGRRVHHRLLAAVAPVPEETLEEALREAIGQQVLVVDGPTEGYTFRHALLQEVVYADLLPAERGRLHIAFAASLEAEPGLAAGGASTAAAELAAHWYAGHDLPRALGASARAGLAAADRYAYAEALVHLERALELWDQVPDAETVAGTDQVTLTTRAALAVFLSGGTARAVALLQAAVDSLDAAAEPLVAGRLWTDLGRFRANESATASALTCFERALALLPADRPGPERAYALACFAHTLSLASRFRDAQPLAEEAIELAAQLGDRVTEGRARTTLGGVLAGFGRVDEATAQFVAARELAQSTEDTDGLARAWVNLSDLLLRAGRPEVCVAMALEGRGVVARYGMSRGAGAFLGGNAAEALLLLGRWDEADDLTKEAEGRESAAMVDVHLNLVRAALKLRRGELAVVEAHLKLAQRATTEAVDVQLRGTLAVLEAQLALELDAPGRALAAVEDGLQFTAGGEDERNVPVLLALRLRALADRSSPEIDEVEDAAVRLAGFTVAEETLPPLDLDGWQAMGAAEAHRALGRDDPAAWAAAASAWERLGRPWERAQARWREGMARLARGEGREAATAALVEAAALASSLGATRLLTEVQTLARRARIALAPSPREAADPDGSAIPGGLTAREREVLALVAIGRTNRQIGEALFISGKTASVHVSNILAKLGAATRGEAAAQARELGLS